MRLTKQDEDFKNVKALLKFKLKKNLGRERSEVFEFVNVVEETKDNVVIKYLIASDTKRLARIALHSGVKESELMPGLYRVTETTSEIVFTPEERTDKFPDHNKVIPISCTDDSNLQTSHDNGNARIAFFLAKHDVLLNLKYLSDLPDRTEFEVRACGAMSPVVFRSLCGCMTFVIMPMKQ